MKKLLIVLFLMAFCLNVHAAVVPNSVSGGTVYFTGLSPAATSTLSTTGQTVTFNNVTSYIYLRNESDYDCYVNIECKPTDSYAGSVDVYTVIVPDQSNTPNTIELDFATKRLSFWAKDVTKSQSGSTVFIVTGVAGDL